MASIAAVGDAEVFGAGLLLTGGASTRMGRDKATLQLGGQTLAARVAAVLSAVADPVLVVGSEAGTGLPAVEDPRIGPLAAVATGAEALTRRGVPDDALVVVLACDLPFVEPGLLRLLARAIGHADAAVPMADGRDQPLCAVYRLGALSSAVSLTASGERSMRSLVNSLRVERLAPERWTTLVRADALDDVDTRGAWEAAVGRLSPPDS